MKTITTLICGLAAIAVTAQNYKFTVEEDDPNFNNLSIRPGIVVDLGLKAGWGAGLALDAQYINSSLPIQFRASFHQNFVGGQNITDLYAPLRGIEAGVGYALVSKTTKKPIRVVIKAVETSSTTTQVTYITPDGLKKKETVLRGGFYMHRSNWEAGDVGNDLSLNINGETSWMQGNTNATGAYAGIGIQSSHNLVTNIEGVGKRRGTLASAIYLDAIIAPSVSFGEWTDVNGYVGPANAVYDINTDSDAQASNLGIRLGYMMNVINAGAKNPNGLYFKIETGTRPAMKGQGFFFLSYLGFVINSK